MKSIFCVFILVLALELFSCGGGQSHSTPTPAPAAATTETAAPSEGAILFGSRCSSCHGGDGTAGIANAANLQTSRLDSATVFQTISNGRNTMPTFSEQLSEAERKTLERYVLTLRK